MYEYKYQVYSSYSPHWRRTCCFLLLKKKRLLFVWFNLACGMNWIDVYLLEVSSAIVALSRYRAVCLCIALWRSCRVAKHWIYNTVPHEDRRWDCASQHKRQQLSKRWQLERKQQERIDDYSRSHCIEGRFYVNTNKIGFYLSLGDLFGWKFVVCWPPREKEKKRWPNNNIIYKY